VLAGRTVDEAERGEVAEVSPRPAAAAACVGGLTRHGDLPASGVRVGRRRRREEGVKAHVHRRGSGVRWPRQRQRAAGEGPVEAQAS
jgi:hypothetical protein